MTIEWVPSTSVTTSGSIMYYVDLDPSAATPSINDLPQQYKAQINALYNASSISYSEEEIN